MTLDPETDIYRFIMINTIIHHSNVHSEDIRRIHAESIPFVYEEVTETDTIENYGTIFNVAMRTLFLEGLTYQGENTLLVKNIEKCNRSPEFVQYQKELQDLDNQIRKENKYRNLLMTNTLPSKIICGVEF